MKIDTANLKVRPVPTLEKSSKTEKGEGKASNLNRKNFDIYEPAVIIRDGKVIHSNLKGKLPEKTAKDPATLPNNVMSGVNHTPELDRKVRDVFENYFVGGKITQDDVKNTLSEVVEAFRQNGYFRRRSGHSRQI